MRKSKRQDSDSARGALPGDCVDLWTVHLAVGSRQAETLWDSLSSDERARADRFAFERDRRRYVVGRGALRGILASYLGGLPGDLRFTYGEHGKPMLAESTSAGGVEFNVSGSEELAVCAVTVGRQVGVDIEFCRPIEDEAFVEQCLAPAERRMYLSLAPKDRSVAFDRLWTLKEAYLKASGAGLSRPLSSLEVAFASDEGARLVADQLLPEAHQNWSLLEFKPGPHHVGALAINGPRRPVHHRRWSP